MLENIYTRINFLRKGLEGLAKRNELIAGNIANIETPGYKAKDINFEEVLARHIHTDTQGNTEIRELAQNSNLFSIYDRQGLPENIDGNNVDIDKEMVALTENKMKYDLVTEALKQELKMLDLVIDASKR